VRKGPGKLRDGFLWESGTEARVELVGQGVVEKIVLPEGRARIKNDPEVAVTIVV
jgi:hypothetical protein